MVGTFFVTRSGDRTPFGARSRGNTRAFSGAAREARSRAEAGAGGAAARGFPSSPPLVTSKVSTPVGLFCYPLRGSNPLAIPIFQMKQKIPFSTVDMQSKWDYLLHLERGTPMAHEVRSRAIGGARRGGDARRSATTHRNGNGHRSRTRRGAACPKLNKLVSKSRERLRRMRAIRAYACSFTSAALLRL